MCTASRAPTGSTSSASRPQRPRLPECKVPRKHTGPGPSADATAGGQRHCVAETHMAPDERLALTGACAAPASTWLWLCPRLPARWRRWRRPHSWRSCPHLALTADPGPLFQQVDHSLQQSLEELCCQMPTTLPIHSATFMSQHGTAGDSNFVSQPHLLSPRTPWAPHCTRCCFPARCRRRPASGLLSGQTPRCR